MDEVNGAATEFTGYSDEGIAAFREFLIAKYVQGAGWQLNDPRWTSKFKIKLDARDECPDGTVRSFNYRAYLKRVNALDQPLAPDRNALAAEWGPPQDLGDDAYCGRRNGAAWKYLVDGIRRYAAEQRRTVYIAANGLNRWVDYQIEGVWDSWPVKDGRLTLGPCYILRWRGAMDWSRNALGRDVPLVVFHDWGFDIPWEKIPKEDRILWLRVYAPEVFASGATFAWPVSGCGGSTRADKNGTLDEIRRLAAWYRLNAPLYRSAEWIGLDAAKTEPLVVTALVQQSGLKRRILHIINRKLVNHALAPRENLRLEITSGAPPKAAWAVSPDFEGRKPLKFSFEKNAVSVTLDRLEAYTVLALEYKALPNDDDLLFPRLTLGTVRQWGVKGGREFDLDRRGIRKSDGLLSGYLHGAYHEEMRGRPVAFRAVFGPNGSVGVRVNSVATLGAELLIRLDGQELMRWKLPDLDRKNDGAALEYDKLFSAKVPPGAHTITIENAGGDWLTMDSILFEGIVSGPPE